MTKYEKYGTVIKEDSYMGYEYVAKDAGKRLKELRVRKKITQEKLAEVIDVSVKHYGALERGKVGCSLQKWSSICEFFGVSLDYIIFGDTLNSKATSFARKYSKRLEKLTLEEYNEFDKIMNIVLRGIENR